MKKGRKILIVSWLIFRLRRAVLYAETAFAQSGAHNIARQDRVIHSEHSIDSTWFLANDSANMLAWRNDKKDICVYSLPPITPN